MIKKPPNQSILKEINPAYSLEGLTLKLKLQKFGHLMRRTDSLEETLILGKVEGKRRRGWQRTRWLDSTTDSMDTNLGELQEIVKDKEAWQLQSTVLQRVGHNLATDQQQKMPSEQEDLESLFGDSPCVGRCCECDTEQTRGRTSVRADVCVGSTGHASPWRELTH